MLTELVGTSGLLRFSEEGTGARWKAWAEAEASAGADTALLTRVRAALAATPPPEHEYYPTVAYEAYDGSALLDALAAEARRGPPYDEDSGARRRSRPPRWLRRGCSTRIALVALTPAVESPLEVGTSGAPTCETPRFSSRSLAAAAPPRYARRQQRAPRCWQRVLNRSCGA